LAQIDAVPILDGDNPGGSAMATSVKELLAAANAAVKRLPPNETRALLDRGNVLLVDVRDPSEVAASGKIKGAVNVSRGMLEFRADPDSPYHDAAFDKTRRCWCTAPRAAARR
jgi:rhodanese-related sulfurtransferase